MRSLIIYFLLVFGLQSCPSPGAAENSCWFTYTASTRGSFIQYRLKDATLHIQQERQAETYDAYPIAPEDWEALQQLATRTGDPEVAPDPEGAAALATDRARQVEFRMQCAGQEPETYQWAEGTPPAELKALVSKILTITQSVESER